MYCKKIHHQTSEVSLLFPAPVWSEEDVEKELPSLTSLKTALYLGCLRLSLRQKFLKVLPPKQCFVRSAQISSLGSVCLLRTTRIYDYSSVLCAAIKRASFLQSGCFYHLVFILGTHPRSTNSTQEYGMTSIFIRGRSLCSFVHLTVLTTWIEHQQKEAQTGIEP